ncbi:hypothetical protein LAZ67_3002639 [Cordylochernes scorpioides]|uniref:RNA-directed DNA polymerase n=1 Tax=Cordylochernes scorpioides TaxID=51811 RepID=A0ABY6KCN2_9ARAC|nr:hypothetical protein LAZ67_3002639 [Cordylochernes scorpioides]
MYTGVEQKDWEQVLPYVTFAYNTAKQEATGYTPFFFVHAREAETYIDAILPYLPDEIFDDYVGELVTRAEEARQLSRSRLLQSQTKDRRLYDQKHTPVYYQKDDLVWVFTRIRKVGLSEKLLKRYFGPYKVTKKLSEVMYEVEPVYPSPRSRNAKDIVHTKIYTILNVKNAYWHIPIDEKDRHKTSFGTIYIYNKFIPHYAQIRAPLNELLLKNAPWLWSAKHEQSLQTLKNSLISQPVLYIYDPSKPCHLFTDASSLGVAGVLKQPDEQGILYPIGYFSRKFHPHEQKYTASEIETLAIINSVQIFHTCLHNIHFTLHTDHLPLKWIKNSSILSQYSFDIKHIKGLNNIEADMLSRAPVSFYLTYNELKEHQSTEQIISAKIKIQNGLYIINRKGFKRAYVPQTLSHKLLSKVHTKHGHIGTTQMTKIISPHYYWPHMTRDIANYTKHCETCQFNKHSIHMIVDHHSIFFWAFPTKSVSTDSYITCLRNVFQINKPEILITDRNAAFLSNKFKHFSDRNNVKHLLTSAHHPETNAKVERLNYTIINRLRCEYNANLKIPWTKYILKITESYNETVHTTTGFTHKFLYYGIQPQSIEHDTETHTPIEKARKLAIERTIKYHEHSKQLYYIKHPEPIFKEGDQIFQGLISTLQLVKKLDRYPFRKKRKIDSVEQEEKTMNIKKEATTQVGSFFVQHLPRNPSMFSGEGVEDPRSWLKGYERVAKHNQWDETLCLPNVYFYLTGTALKWYENNEESIQTWKEFISRLRAEKILKTRAQLKGESTEYYIQDVLRLCKEVDPQMNEKDKISHLMKGIAEELYQALLPRDVHNTEQFVTECRRIESLHCKRVTPTKYERLPNVASLSDHDDRADLSSMIRQIYS